MDESPKQIIEDARPSKHIKPGQQERVDYEYIRKGVVNIFMANEPLAGKRYTKVTDYKKKPDWVQFMKEVASQNRKAKKITVVMDNLNTHTRGAFYESLKPKEAKKLLDRFDFVFTPKHGSWLNMAEIELRVMTGQCLKSHLESKFKIEKEVKAWENNRNALTIKIDWQFTTKDARIKLKRLYPSHYV